ncbi:MAG: acyl-CoA dehydrogenase [Pirellulaceae bacterium]|nr:acyl-CoA dehydrogenase [Pirellulaceae bacterium]
MNAPVAKKRAHTERREKQVREAEELLFSGPQRQSFGKSLFSGNFVGSLVFPYPALPDDQQAAMERALEQLRKVCDQYLDPDQIDRNADIPQELISGLGEIGLLGMTAPVSVGGRNFSQLAYCRLLEELGSRCSSTSIFVNAHHSIGMRGLLLFGTDDQKQKWLPGLVSGEKIAAFALTESQAGSDASNVQTTATLTDDGQHFVLNGTKRYITNGAIADLLTVMARTKVADSDETAVTAFLVTPDMPGFRVIEPRMEKLGIRGTATAKLAFDQMQVPVQNVLGPIGKGLRVALTVLDFGRTTFGACCTGAAKTCVRLANEHAHRRVQFGQTLAEFELVQKKLALISADTYAMEAMTKVTAGLIDGGCEDYMLETAMLKVWSTERLWEIVNETFQIYGGAAYFTDQPLERMLRDARINQIGEGANEVLTSFIGLVGMRDPGEELRTVAEAAVRSWRHFMALARFSMREASRRCSRPKLTVRSSELKPAEKRLAKQIKQFGICVQRELIRHREDILERQLVHERFACAAMEIYAATAVISRRDAEIQTRRDTDGDADRQKLASFFLAKSERRVRECLRGLRDNDDVLLIHAAETTG